MAVTGVKSDLSSGADDEPLMTAVENSELAEPPGAPSCSCWFRMDSCCAYCACEGTE